MIGLIVYAIIKYDKHSDNHKNRKFFKSTLW